MTALLLPAAVVGGIVVLTPLADRIRVPQPILLLIYGLGLAAVPGLPPLPLPDAGLILPIILPPLLFAATQRTTFGQFRDAAAPVLLLAVGLTLATAAVVAWLAHLTGLGWPAAVVLGAIVSPPDPVAATAVARRLRLPERMSTILEGEGLFNDATALVLYQVALTVAVTGEFSAADAGVELLLSLGVGISLGLLLGWLTKTVLAALRDAGAETTVTVAMPFVAYLTADELRGSGVLAVLSLGLFLRSYGHPALTARGWLLGRSVWDYADFLITGLVFVLVGFELTTVFGRAGAGPGVSMALVGQAALVLAGLVLVRPLWLFPATAVARVLQRRRANGAVPLGRRETLVVSWAGMRGVVTIATALALPAATDTGEGLLWRQPVVFVALSCVLVTLLVQGLTLTPLVRRLGVGSDTDESAEIEQLRLRAMRAGLDALRARAEQDDDPVGQAAILQYEGRLRAHEAIVRTVHGQTGEDLERLLDSEDEDLADLPDDRSRDLAHRLGEALQAGNDTEREVVLRARADGEVSPAAADRVLYDIEARAVRIVG